MNLEQKLRELEEEHGPLPAWIKLLAVLFPPCPECGFHIAKCPCQRPNPRFGE